MNKKITILISLFFFTATAFAQLNQGLIAYYPFSGNTNDASGHGFNGTVQGAVLTADRFGISNSAYQFNNINSNGYWISMPPFTGYSNIGDFTVSLWAKMYMHFPDGGRSYFLDLRGDNVFQQSGCFMIVDGSGSFSAVHSGLNYTQTPDRYTEYAVPINSPIGIWTHFVLIREGNTLRTFLNGVQLPNIFTGSSIGPLSDLIDFSNGGRIGNYSGGGASGINGAIDEVRIYNRALSNTEINELFTGQNISCGHNNDKVLVCHNGHTICISQNAVQTHLNHGDHLGNCGDNNIIESEIPNQFSLSQNYPNPFNPTTNIKFALPKNSFAKLVIYDVLGREVAILVNVELNAGSYQADWDAANYSSGIYYYTLQAGDFKETRKMVLIK